MSQPFDNNNHSLNDGVRETFQSDKIQSLKSVSGTGQPQAQPRADFSQSMRKSSLNISTPQYVGELKEGMKNGYGLWLESKDDPNSNQYRGEFMNDKKCGYGVFRWSSGNYYKGNFKNDERDGYGEMHWNDGSVYKGQWHNGIQHGFGTMIFSDKTYIKGYFKNNVYLNANTIKDKPQKVSLSRPPIESNSYNLPIIPPTSYKSPKKYTNLSLMEEIIENSTISHETPERK